MSLVKFQKSSQMVFSKPAPGAQSGFLYFNFIGTEYTVNTDVDVHPYCNSITIINKGTEMAYVNGIPLKPPVDPALSGESITIGGNLGELFKGRCQIVVTAADATPLVVVVQKYYTPDNG